MSSVIECDATECGHGTRVVRDVDDQVVATVTPPPTPGLPRGVIDPPGVLNFHTACWSAQGPVMPAPGTVVRVHRVAPPT